MRYVKAEYLDFVEVRVPGEAKPRRLHVWRNPETGNLVAVDNLELPAARNVIPDPYADGVALVFHDTFTGLPK